MISLSRLGVLLADLEEYIRAVVIDMQSDHVEDSVRVTELRQELIDNLIEGKYRE